MLSDRTNFFASIRTSEFGGELSQPQVDGFNALLDAIPDTWDKRWAAYALATAVWETNLTMQPVREAYWLSEAWRKANLRYYPYYGRGFCQITWDYNYRKFGQLLGVNLFEIPDLALKSEYAAKILVYGMENGTFSGRKLADYFTLAKTDYVGARWIINGQDKAASIASIAEECYKALTA